MYHTQGEKDMEPSMPDTLLLDIIDFFTNKNYNQNTIDVLMKIVADVLNIDLNIYQNNRGQIQVLNFAGDNSTCTVNVKFTHDNSITVVNHYNAITPFLNLTTLKKTQNEEVSQHLRSHS